MLLAVSDIKNVSKHCAKQYFKRETNDIKVSHNIYTITCFRELLSLFSHTLNDHFKEEVVNSDTHRVLQSI